MDARSARLQHAALEYVRLGEEVAERQAAIGRLRIELVQELQKGEGVEVDANTVLVVCDRVAARKAVTQKILKAAGVPDDCFERIMKATRPRVTAKKGRKLKTMLLSAFEASLELARKQKAARAVASEESAVDEEGDEEITSDEEDA